VIVVGGDWVGQWLVKAVLSRQPEGLVHAFALFFPNKNEN
jgi:hypothetical protein